MGNRSIIEVIGLGWCFIPDFGIFCRNKFLLNVLDHKRQIKSSFIVFIFTNQESKSSLLWKEGNCNKHVCWAHYDKISLLKSQLDRYFRLADSEVIAPE